MKSLKSNSFSKWSLPGLFVILALAIVAGGNRPDGPRFRQEREPAMNAAALSNGPLWQSIRVPPLPIVKEELQRQGKLALGADEATVEAAVRAWYTQASKEVYFGPNPFAYRDLLKRETQLLQMSDGPAPGEFGDDEKLSTPKKNVLGVLVQFDPTDGEEVITRAYPVDPADPSLGCSDQDFTFTSLAFDQDPPPGPADNFFFFKPGIGIEDYESAFFGIGPDAGYGVVRPDLGGIDLTGISLNNYLLEMSGGEYTTDGGFLADTLSLPHSHEFYGYAVYGEDDDGNCFSAPFSDANYGEFVFDTLAAITEAYDGDPNLDWSQYDADGDQIIDLLVIIHAGYAYQNGGGEDRLSTSSSGFFTPQQVAGFTTPDDESDDYYVQGFNVDPEQLDVGGIQEEFEHQFGLPDMYAVDGDNSNAFWSAHSAGVWGGPLGGTRPVGHNLWQDWVLGWRDPTIIQFDDPALLASKLEIQLGRARYTPEGLSDGAIIRLPDGEIAIDNEAGEGLAWYSQSGDLLDHRVYREFDLTEATAPLTFTFDAWWDIEEDWDYGLIEFSIDGGTTWQTMPDEDGILTDEDPNDVGVVVPGEAWGLTGAGEGALTFDISDYAGETLAIRLRYLTDGFVSNPGWQVDNLSLTDADGVIYENDLEEDFSDWTNEGWVTVPLTITYDRYYLLEWRDDNGFDASLNDPYHVAFSNPVEPPPEVTVDRLPATTPGLVVAYRDTSQGFDYGITDSLFTGQSIGAKFAHLVVDSHVAPQRFETLDPSQDDQVGLNLRNAIMAGDAAFGFEPTQPWTARLGYDPTTGESFEEKSWDSQVPIAAFHDSYGYYPGLFFSAATGFVYFNAYDASVVLPASGPYTTRITDPDGNPLPDFYGATVAGFELGTGNPGDSHVHYGLHAEVVDGNDYRGIVHLWNRSYEVKLATATDGVLASGEPLTTTFEIVENIGGRLENPLVVVTLPDGVAYEEGSGFGGLTPVGGDGLRSPKDVAAFVAANGRGALDRLRVAPADATFLVWAGDDIWTGTGVEPFGFGWTAEPDVTHVTFDVSMFRDGLIEFQTASVEVNEYPYQALFPVMTR